MNSLQGDSALIDLYTSLGVESTFTNDGVCLEYTGDVKIPTAIDLIETPDLAQTIIVSYAALNLPIRITGLKTLRIKETRSYYRHCRMNCQSVGLLLRSKETML